MLRAIRALAILSVLAVPAPASAQAAELEASLESATRQLASSRGSAGAAQAKLEQIRAQRAAHGGGGGAYAVGGDGAGGYARPTYVPAAAYAPAPGARGGGSGRIRVGVLPFENRVPQIPGNFVDGIEAMLISEGLDRTEWVMVDRVVSADVLTEQKFARSGLVQAGTGPGTGRNLGAQVLIKGVVTTLTQGSSGGGFGLGFRGVSLGRGGSKATLGMDVRIIDAATGEVLAAAHKSTKVKSSDFSLGVATGRAPAFTFNNFKNSPMGDAARRLVGEILGMLSAALPRVRIETPTVSAWSGRVAQVNGSRIYVNGGRNSNLQVGQTLKVLRASAAIIDPQTGENLGSEVAAGGTLRVVDVQDRFSICVLQSGSAPRVNDVVSQ